MKVAHLTSAHPRFDTRIFLKECRTLAEENEVTLVVADGKGDESRDGIRIVDAGRAGGRLGRMIGAVDRVFEVAALLDVDVYHLHDPELLRVARKLRHIGGGRLVVFDAHEDLPRQILSKRWIPRRLRRPISLIAELAEKRVARKLSGVVAATPHIAEKFLKYNPRTLDINNYPMLEELAPSAHRLPRKRQVCYVGGITRVRGIDVLIRSLPLAPEVRLVLCGVFQEPGLETAMRALPGWEQVEYRGHVGREEVRQVLAESTAGVVTLLPTPAYLDALPVKMFEYMSAELPVVASAFPLWRDIIDGAGAGICVDPTSPEGIAAAINRLLADSMMAERMGRAGREAIVTRYNWPTEAAKLLAFYKELK